MPMTSASRLARTRTVVRTEDTPFERLDLHQGVRDGGRAHASSFKLPSRFTVFAPDPARSDGALLSCASARSGATMPTVRTRMGVQKPKPKRKVIGDT